MAAPVAAIIAAVVAAASAAAQAGIAADTANKQKAIADQLGDEYDKIPIASYENAILGRYTPQVPSVPDDISFEQLKRDPEMRQKMMDAVQQFLTMSDSSIQSKSDSDRALAAMDADQAAAARSGAIRNEMFASGRGGSGLQYGLMDEENQKAAMRRYIGGLQAANNAQNERLNAFREYQRALGENEGVDLGIQGKNTDTINKFNTLNAQRRDAINQRIADIRNDAELKNIGLQQWGILRNDQNQNNRFGQRMAIQSGKANAYNQKQNILANEGGAYSEAVGQIGDLAGEYLGYEYGKKKGDKVGGNS